MSYSESRFGELVLFFFLVPTIYALGLIPLPALVFLWIGSLLAYFFLSAHKRFRWSKLWSFDFKRKELVSVILRFLFFSFLMMSFVYFFFPEHFFYLPLNKPDLWIKLMILYPIISVIPQSFVYRVFFIERYSRIFRSRFFFLVLGSIAFAFMHLIFRNWVAVLLTAVGGFLFLDTYLRSRNFVLSTMEHSLYGCFAFTVGLGSFLYSGDFASLWD
ncbi:MAG: CPBP family intramembrane glutamate endopeptidase [Bdellovibrionota bacterium]